MSRIAGFGGAPNMGSDPRGLIGFSVLDKPSGGQPCPSKNPVEQANTIYSGGFGDHIHLPAAGSHRDQMIRVAESLTFQTLRSTASQLRSPKPRILP